MTAAVPLLLAAASGVALAVSHAPLGWSLAALVVPALLVAAWDVRRSHGVTRTWPLSAVASAIGHGAMLWWLTAPAGFIGWGLLTVVHVGWWVLLGAVVTRLPHAWWRAPAVAFAWVGIDTIRSVVPLNGFAWGTLGAAGVDLPWLVPLARLAGEAAITVAVVLLSVAAWEALRGPLDAARQDLDPVDWYRLRDELPAGRSGTAWLAGTALVVTLATVEPPAPSGHADVLLVQPAGGDPFAGTARELDLLIAQRALELTRERVAAGGPPDVTVWPESTIDRDPAREPELAEVLAAGGRAVGGGLVAGTNLDGEAPRTFLNVLQVIDRGGSVTNRYIKRSLVPFGEYIPFRAALDWFPPLDQVPRDAIPGPGPQQLDAGGVRIAPLICFETLFGGVLRSNLHAGDPAQLVVAATNDASFGRGGAALQHLAQSRLRAVETGRWVAHSAISGRSAFVDPDGRVHDLTGLFQAGTARRTVPLVTGRTPFLVTGNWLGPTSVVALALLAAFAARSSRRRDLPGGSSR